MEGRKHWVQRLTEGADLPDEVVPGLPVVELAGDRRVLIEQHRGVTEYGCERICVRVRFGEVCICGCGLELNRMTKEQLVVSGRIDSIHLRRRGK